jgi:tetratricopeptide (TPR) repeat protein
MKPRVFLLFILQFYAVLGYSQTKNPLINLEIKLVNGQYDSVIFISKNLIEKDSSQAFVFYYLGKAYQAKYKFFNAEDAFKMAFLLDSTNRTFQNGLAETYEAIGKDEDAINIYYTQYLDDTLDISPIINLANIFRKNKEFGSAIHYYQKAIAIDSNNFYYFKQIAYCFNQINMSTPAILYYAKAIEINPYDLNVYIILANILNGERQFNGAINVCNEGLGIDTLNVQLKKILAYTYYLNKEFDLSIKGFNELISNNDSLFFNFKYRGLAYFENKDLDSAILDLRKAFELENSDPEVAFYLGSALGRLNEYNEGVRFLNLSIALLAPPPREMSNIYSELASIELSRENYTKSLEYIKLAYQSHPNPLYSFKMAQLYDQYLNDKKLAINYYDGYLTMIKEKKSENGENILKDNTELVYKEFAIQRIKILTEELFFEGK